ncbi:MAG TPA: patatin-like phospholipase family protein [Gemmatimonadales bacterium]
MTPPRITLVLSGGGMKAVAHLGAVRALREAGLTPTRYVGTSMGAVMGAGLAAGLSPEEVMERTRTLRRRDLVRLSATALVQGVFATALLHAEPLQRTLARLIPATSFDELKLPLTVTATDLDTGQLVCFGAGGDAAPLQDALYASCALPVWFPPGLIAGRRLADGGLRGPVPLSVAARFPADLVVAVDAGPGTDAVPRTGRLAPPPLVRIHGDAVGALMARTTELEVALWRASEERPRLIYVRPIAERGMTFAVQDVGRYEATGYTAMREALGG